MSNAVSNEQIKALAGTPAEGWNGIGPFPSYMQRSRQNQFGAAGSVDPDRVVFAHKRLREGRRTPSAYASLAASREKMQLFKEESERAGFAVFMPYETSRGRDAYQARQSQQFGVIGDYQVPSKTVLPMALGFVQAPLIGDELLPGFVGGPDLKAAYPVLGQEIYNITNTKKQFGQKSERIDITPKWITVTTTLHHKETIVDEAERAAGAFLPTGLDTIKTDVLRGQMELEKEVDQYNLLTTTSNYLSGNYQTLSGGGQWSNDASDPINEVTLEEELVRSLTGTIPDTFAMGPLVLRALKRNPKVIDCVKYTGTLSAPAGFVPPATLVELFQKRILVGYAGIATPTPSTGRTDVWGKNALLICTGGGAVIAQRFGITPTAPGYPKFLPYTDQSVGSGTATVYKYSMAWDVAVVNNTAGSGTSSAAYLWINAVA